MADIKVNNNNNKKRRESPEPEELPSEPDAILFIHHSEFADLGGPALRYRRQAEQMGLLDKWNMVVAHKDYSQPIGVDTNVTKEELFNAAETLINPPKEARDKLAEGEVLIGPKWSGMSFVPTSNKKILVLVVDTWC